MWCAVVWFGWCGVVWCGCCEENKIENGDDTMTIQTILYKNSGSTLVIIII